MKYTISPDNRTLTLTASPEEMAELKEIHGTESPDTFTDQQEIDALEELIANSELDWINPDDTGDLTAAPLLGILGTDRPGSDKTKIPDVYGWVYVGRWHNGKTRMLENHFQPILQRWGYHHYQLRSFLTDLMETGKAEFINSW